MDSSIESFISFLGRTVSANDQVGGFLRHKPERCFWLMFLGTTAIKPSTIIIVMCFPDLIRTS